MERIVLGIFLLLCAIFDQRTQKIPNWLCGVGAMMGCFIQGYLAGMRGLLEGITFAGVIFIALLPFWRWKVLGGGDVKLMMVSGFFLKGKVFALLFLSAVCTGVYSLFLMLIRKNFLERMRIFAEYIRICILDGAIEKYPFDRENTDDCRGGGVFVSYGILTGYLLGILMKVLV